MSHYNPLTRIPKPQANWPDTWDQPCGTLMDGKCGLTAVANMLRWYGAEISPKSLDKRRYRSWGPGLRRDKFAEDMNQLWPGSGFQSRDIPNGYCPLRILRGHINAGRPVAINYMTNSLAAHWVVVVQVSDEEDNPLLVVQSGGGYHQTRWLDIQDAWRRGWGGEYPHVVGSQPAAHLGGHDWPIRSQTLTTASVVTY
ncbi:MAG: hypothetical protein HC924_09655 [Synechococcaceae cyanobacterium SM2_3_2]|nr:hypothetical protein [Synechococcaceae cyanobacterium SM2_3_2]